MARRILEEGNIVYQYDLFQNSDLLFIKLILLEHKGGDMLSILDDIDVSRDRDILTLEKSDLEILEKWLDENKKYTEPEYKLVSYHFLKNDKLNVVYEHKNENDAFIMMLENNNIEDTINLYYDKIDKFREKNSFTPRDWTIRISVLKQILKKINTK